MRILLIVVFRARNFAAGAAAQRTAMRARGFRIAGTAPPRAAFITGDSRRKNPTAAVRVGRLR